MSTTVWAAPAAQVLRPNLDSRAYLRVRAIENEKRTPVPPPHCSAEIWIRTETNAGRVDTKETSVTNLNLWHSCLESGGDPILKDPRTLPPPAIGGSSWKMSNEDLRRLCVFNPILDL